MDSNYWVYQSTYEVLGAKVLGGWNVFGLDPTSMFWVTVEWRTENCWARNNLLFWFFFGQNNYCRWHDSKCSPWKHHSNHADLIKSQVHLPQSTITAPLDSYDLEILQTHIMMMTMTTMQMVLTCFDMFATQLGALPSTPSSHPVRFEKDPSRWKGWLAANPDFFSAEGPNVGSFQIFVA